MSDNTTILIEGTDYCKSGDQDESANKNTPKNIVKIYEIDDETGEQKLIHEDHNLVVYLGREWLAARAMNQNNTAATCGKANCFLSWVGFGYGGADPINRLVPIPPKITDTNLYAPRMINTASKGKYADYGNYGDGYGWYKVPIPLNPPGYRFDQDPLNMDAYLRLTVSATLDNDDCIDNQGNGKEINEAALFVCDSTDAEISGPFYMYARITFPTIIKQNNRRLLINWRLYF
jgi:hypothetical protein